MTPHFHLQVRFALPRPHMIICVAVQMQGSDCHTILRPTLVIRPLSLAPYSAPFSVNPHRRFSQTVLGEERPTYPSVSAFLHLLQPYSEL